MSQTYKNYPRSTFPEKIDEFPYMTDIDANLYVAANAYNTYVEQGNFVLASQYLNANPELKNSLFNADKYNQILDAMMSLEEFFNDEVKTYLAQIVVNRGLWDEAVTDYKKYNVVISSSGFPYVATQDVPENVSLDNTDYWIPLGIKGEQGESGSGLTPRGEYSEDISYSMYDLVKYDDLWWYTLKDNVSSTPSENSTDWFVFYTPPTADEALSLTSINPVQNKVIAQAIEDVKNAIPTVSDSAEKLTNAKNLWGNSFDGSENVGGDMTFDNSYAIKQVDGGLGCSGTFTATKVYNAVFNDYAEWFERENLDEPLEPGDICSWSTKGVTKSNGLNDNLVVGVYSDSYGQILGGDKLKNMEDNIAKYVPIGLSGRIDVKVTGKVKKGDLIVSSDIKGVGTVNNEASNGTIIGKALEDKDTMDISKIKVLIFNH